MPVDHDFHRIAPRLWQCSLCEDTLGNLSARDVAYLNSNGKCIGKFVVWRKCERTGFRQYCQHEDCPPLLGFDPVPPEVVEAAKQALGR